jgi:hypothetical protein
MREQGVECAAMRRVHRGITQKPEHSTLRHMRKRDQVPNAYRQQSIRRRPCICSQRKVVYINKEITQAKTGMHLLATIHVWWIDRRFNSK